MPKIDIGEWLPDLSPMEGSQVIQNVKPLGNGYKELEAGEVITNALTARVQGFGTAQNTSGQWFSYAGDSTKLYMSSANTWASAGTGYTLGVAERWEFVNFRGVIIALSKGEEPVEDTAGTGTFATFMSSTKKPKAAQGAIVKSHLVLGNYNDGTEYLNGVIWSSSTDYTDFDPDTQTGSGAQYLESTGTVQKIVGGEYGTIFLDDSIWVMTYEGPPTLFRFDKVADNVGALGGGSVINLGNTIYFLSLDGFWALTGSELRRIGQNKIDEYVLANLDRTNLDRISSVAEAKTGLIYWSYPSSSGNPKNIVIYNPHQGRWSYATFEHELLVNDRTKSITLDDATWGSFSLDAPAIASLSVDASRFLGGVSQIGHFDTAHRTQLWTGTGRTATLDTPEVQFFEGGRAFINKARPYVTGGDAAITVAVGTREQLSDTVSYGTAVAPNSFGEVPLRSSSRFMTFRTVISDGFDETLGIEVEPIPAGVR